MPLSICQQSSGTVLFYQQTGSKERGFFGCLGGIYCKRDRESCFLRKKFFLFVEMAHAIESLDVQRHRDEEPNEEEAVGGRCVPGRGASGAAGRD